MLNKKIIGCTIINIMIAYYLTSIIAQITLATKLQEVLVFAYFIVLLTSGTAFWIKRKIGSKLSKKKCGLAIIMAALFAVNFSHQLLPKKYEENLVVLTAQNEKNQNSQGMEVWLNAVSVNGKEQNLYEIVRTTDDANSWAIMNGSLMANADKSEPQTVLKLAKADSIELRFGRHEWSGIVEVESGEYIEQYDLYDENGSELVVKIPTMKSDYLLVQNIFFIIGIMGIAFYCSLFLLHYITSKINGPLTWGLIGIIVSFFGYLCIIQPVEVTIQPLETANINSRGTEVWINTINNKRPEQYEEIQVPEGWFIKDGALVSTGDGKVSPFVVTLRSINDEIVLQKHPWSGSVKIITNWSEDIIDLYSDGSGEFHYEIPWGRLKSDVVVSVLAAMWGVIIAVPFLGEKFDKVSFSFLIVGLILANSNELKLDISLMFLMLVITAIVSGMRNYIFEKCVIQKYKQQKIRFLIVVISIYAAFASFGHILFLDGDYISATMSHIVLFVFGVYWWHAVINTLLFLLEKLVLKVQCRSNRSQIVVSEKKLRFTLFLILFFVWELALFAYWPGNMTSDSVDQWLQAIGIRQINTAHPAIYALIIRFLAMLIESPAFVLSFQIIVMAWLISGIFLCLFKRGKHIWLGVMITVLYAVLPSNYMLVTTLWKDIPFTMCLVGLTYLLYNEVKEPETFWKRKLNIFYVIVALIGIKELRHNGILVYIFTLIYFLCAAVKRRKLFFKYVSTVMACVISVAVLHGPIYSFFNVNEAATSKPFVTMFAALGSAINKGKEFSPETTEVLYEIMKKEDWINYYSPFNIDSYRHNPQIEGGMNVNKVNVKQAFSCYMEGLVKYPDILIKDRLDGSDIVWDMTQPSKSFNARCAKGIHFPPKVEPQVLGVDFTNEKGMTYVPNNIFTSYFDDLKDCIIESKIGDMFLFRSGIYLIGYLILLVFNIVRKNKKFLIASIPLIWNTVALMLLLAHQSYRYVWYIPLCVMTLFILTITDKQNLQVKVYENRDSDISNNK